MSLDVYLTVDHPVEKSGSGIFIREEGQMREITRAEWDEKHPNREPVIPKRNEPTYEVFSANITHNLNTMADAVGIYKYLWRPDEIGITKAKELIGPLTWGLERLKSDPEKFKKLNPPNGWGSYDIFVPWVQDYLNACCANPEAKVSVSR